MKYIDVGVEIDLQRLIETRLLIQANSGAGKSHLIRKLLEEAFGKVPILILDLEGEFHSLREKYGFVLFGKDADYPTDIRWAGKTAELLMRTRASAVIDLYELKNTDRVLYVKRFLESLINIPKELYHSTLVVVDEAHVFCPEGRQSDSANAVIELCTRGRKRGLCAVLATQRISKLNKDAAAECLNKFIGRTTLDIDMKRAVDELGFMKKIDMYSLRELEVGQFFCFGPAMKKGNYINKVKIKNVLTSHPKVGSISKNIATPSNEVKKILEQLKEIPAEAEKELRTIESFKKELNEVRRENSLLRNQLTKVSKVDGTIEQKYMNMADRYNSLYEFSKEIFPEIFDGIDKHAKMMLQVIRELEGVRITSIGKVSSFISKNKLASFKKEEGAYQGAHIIVDSKKKEIRGEKYHTAIMDDVPKGSEAENIGKCARSILAFLSLGGNVPKSKIQISVFTGYSIRSSGFINAMSRLKVAGLISIESKDKIYLNNPEVARKYFNESDAEFNKEIWLQKLSKCPRSIYQYLLENSTTFIHVDHIAEITGYSVNSSGFINAVSKLNTLGLIVKENKMIKLNPELL